MPRTFAFGSLFVVALAATGCLQRSLNPLLAKPDAPIDARFIGEWTSGDTTWSVTKTSDKDVFEGREFFEVKISRKKASAVLAAWAGAIGPATFINFFPESDSVHLPLDFFKAHLLETHSFGRIWIEDNKVRLRLLQSEWVEKASKEKRLDLAVGGWPDGHSVITASTDDLQRFARAHADDREAFGEAIELTRRVRR
jgi:hypothetical protein